MTASFQLSFEFELPQAFDWQSIATPFAAYGLRVAGSHATADAPFTLNMVAHLGTIVPSAPMRQALTDALYHAQAELLARVSDAALDDWLASVIERRDWFPILNISTEEVADGLFYLLQRLPPGLADRIRAAADRYVQGHLLDTARTPANDLRNTASTVRSQLLLIQNLTLHSSLPILRQFLRTAARPPLSALDLHGLSPRELGVYVLADFALTEDAAHFLNGCREASTVLPCYRALLVLSPPLYRDLFWRSVARLGDSPAFCNGPLRPLCDLFVNRGVALTLDDVVAQIERLWQQTESLVALLLAPMIAALTQHCPGLHLAVDDLSERRPHWQMQPDAAGPALVLTVNTATGHQARSLPIPAPLVVLTIAAVGVRSSPISTTIAMVASRQHRRVAALA